MEPFIFSCLEVDWKNMFFSICYKEEESVS